MLTLVTAPVPLRGPVSVEELKGFARIDGADEDNLLSEFLTAATKAAERYTQRAFLSQTWDLTYDSFASLFRIPLGETQSITSISYVDVDGATQTVTSTVYREDLSTEPARITLAANQSWPTANNVTNAVTVRFLAGYGAESTVPQEIKDAIRVAASYRYMCREGDYQEAFFALLSTYRLFGGDQGAAA